MNLQKLQPRIARAVVLLLAAGFIQTGLSAPAAYAAAPIKPTITSVTSDAGTITVNLATTGIDATQWRWSLTRRQTFGCDNSYTDGYVNSTGSLSSTISIYGTTEGCRYLIKVAGFNGVIGEYAEYDEVAGGATNGLNIFIKTESGLSANMTRTPLNKNSAGICNLLLGRVNNIDVDYGSSSPSPGYCPVDGFTSYYIGYIKAPYTGAVTFRNSSDDGFILNIQGQNIIDYPVDTAPQTYNASGSINMVANEIYRFEAWHHENAAGSSVKLFWDWSGSGGTVIVPQASFATDPSVFFGTCPLGLTSQCAAGSAMEIKRATGTNMDGNYWIMVNGVPTLTYCIMNSVMSGGGWMLALKGAETGSTLSYTSPLWTDNSLTNESYPARWSKTDALKNVDAKYGVFTSSKTNQIMALFPRHSNYAGGAIPASTTGNTSTPYGFSWLETTTAGRTWTSADGDSWNTNSGTGKPNGSTCINVATTLTNLFTNASRCAFRTVNHLYSLSETPYSAIGQDLFYSQINIRFFGINYANNNSGGGALARLGFGWNENGPTNESSNDGSGGIGLQYASYPVYAGSINQCCADVAFNPPRGQYGISGSNNNSSTAMAYEMYIRNSISGTVNGNSLRVVLKRINSLTAGNGYTVTGSNGSNTFRLSPAREGFFIDPSTGKITVSEQIAVGEYSMSVTSTDTDGVVGTRAITVQVLSESRETDTALSFNGSTQFSATAGTYGLWGNQTYEAWVKPTSACSQGSGNSTAFGSGNIVIFCRSNYWFVSMLDNNNAWSERQTSLPVVNGEWIHLAVVRSNTTVTFFGNNSQLNFWSGTAWVSSYTQSTMKNDYYTFYVGGTGGANQYFNGVVDEVKVWDSARTLSEIWNGAQRQENVSQANLLMYYDFNEGSGNAISRAQRQDNNFNLTPTSAAQWVSVIETSTSAPYTVVTIPRTLISINPGWRTPSYINAVTALIAGGGAGGGGGGYKTESGGGGGGGGGSGAISQARINVEPNTLYPIIVGASGAGGLSGNPVNWNGTNGVGGETTSAFSIIAKGGQPGWGAAINAGGSWTDGTSGFGGASGNNFLGGAKSTTVGSGGAGGGGATANGTSAGVTTSGAAGGAGLSSSITLSPVTYAVGGAGGVGSTASGAAGVDGGSAAALKANGGTGGGGAVNALPGYGGSGSSGFVILRYITAQKPTFTQPRNTTLNVGMVESFSVNIAADSATAMLTRTFRWESSTTGSNGTFSFIKTGTGAANAEFAWTPPDTRTSGSNFLFRVVVTDSDTDGLSIVETSTAVFATINGRLVLNGKSSLSKTVNISKTETFTVTGGTSTFRYTLSPDGPNFWLDTSTVGSPRLRMLDTVTVGTYYETITVTDSISATSVIPLTIKVSPPPSFSANAEQVDSGTVLYLDAGNTSSYSGTGATWTDISGLARNANMNSALGSRFVTTTRTACVAPEYSGENLGVLNFSSGTNSCGITPNVGILNSYTIQTWLKTPAPQSDWTAVITNPWAGSGKQLNISVFWTANRLTAGIFDGATFFYATGFDNNQVPNNTWVFMTVTFDGANVKIFLDRDGAAQLSETKSVAGRVAFDGSILDTGLAIGRRWDGDQYFTGTIGSVRLYNRVLSDSEIQQNYNVTKGRFANTQNKQAQAGKYGTRYSDTFTVTAGSETITAAWSNTALTRITWDTSTARSLVLSSQESLTPGTYFDTITVTDVYGSLTRLPLTYTIAKADTITVWIETRTAVNYTGTIAVFPTTVRVSGLVHTDTGTAISSIKYRPGGTSCATGGICNVGDIGPGGGIVFITPATAGGNGRFFEAAPFNWAGSDELGTNAAYCSNSNLNLGATNVGIGWGETNTNLAKSACLGGAVARVNSFNLANNTGYSDWFIPSTNELIELAKVRTSVGLLSLGSNWTVGRYGYWSSTEATASVQQSLVTSTWSIGGTGKGDTSNNLVRPVRAFSPCWITTGCASQATTSKPIDAGTYAINAETLTISSGDLSNYVAIRYETTAVTINRIAQSVQQGVIYNALFPDTFTLLSLSGSGNGAVSYTAVGGGTATGCAADYKKFAATTTGTCNVQIVRLGDRNYFGGTSTAYVYFMAFVINQPSPSVGSGPNIALTGQTSVQLEATVAPTISALSVSSGAIGSTITITGAGFYFADPSKLSIKFWRNVGAITYTIVSDTSVTVTVPASATTGRIILTTPNGQAASSTFTVTA